MTTDTAKVLDTLGKMTVLELVELKKAIEEEWGVTAAAPMAAAAPAAAPPAAATATGAAAVTSKVSSNSFTNSESSMSVISLKDSMSSAVLSFAMVAVPFW